MTAPRLIWEEIAPGCAFHAARPEIGGSHPPWVRPHCHDFYEFILILEDGLAHTVNSVATHERRGSFLLLRPDDVHEFRIDSPTTATIYNVAFPADVFQDYVVATGLQAVARQWVAASSAPRIGLSQPDFDACRHESEHAVRAFIDGPSRMAFSRYWSVAAWLFSHFDEGTPSIPDWLLGLRSWMDHAAPDELTMDGLIDRGAVSLEHLCRSTRRYLDVTPTQLLNRAKLRHAAFLLAVTSQEIIAIASDCGFENLSYFYRRFKAEYGKSPRDYRRAARRTTALASDDLGTFELLGFSS